MERSFFTFSSSRIADLLRRARHSACFIAPGVQTEVARALAEVAARLGPHAVAVSLDVDERVLRMGYGSLEGIKILRAAGVAVDHVAGLRTALVVSDTEGYVMTPTARYLETEPTLETTPNAVRLSGEQLAEAMARLSPVAKAIAIAQTTDAEGKSRIAALPADVASEPLSREALQRVQQRIEEAPPVQFDLARQVRVFEPYLQYVDLALLGAAVQRHKLTIPASIQRLGGSGELEGRLRTTFDLIERRGALSSKRLEDELNEIRKNFTPSLGKAHGRVVLKAAKPHLAGRLNAFRGRLAEHKEAVAKGLQEKLDESRKQIVSYYLPIAKEKPPDALRGRLLSQKITENQIRSWLDAQLDTEFPRADSLIKEMELHESYKDVTFETLKRQDFLEAVKSAFPDIDWDRAYGEFLAAGEKRATGDSVSPGGHGG